MSLCEVVCAWRRWCCLRRGMCLASRQHQWLLLAFDFIAHQVPDILIQGLVLGLTAEVHLVLRHGSWVCQTYHSSLTNLCEGSAPIYFSLCQRRCAVAVNRSVLAVGTLAVVVASAVLFGDFARKVMDRVFVNNLCHMCSAIEPNRPPRRAVRPLRC